MNTKNFLPFVITLALVSSCSDNTNTGVSSPNEEPVVQDTEIIEIEESLEPTTGIIEKPVVKLSESDVIVSEWVSGLDIPWELAFIDESTALVTERGGNIYKIVNGEVLPEPFWEARSLERGEGGLMGLTLHPDYKNNGFLYVMYTYTKENSSLIANKVVRLKNTDDRVIIDQVILDDIPAKLYHNGGRVHFGPDEKLYITTGDASNPQIAQDLSSLGGKILRLNDDGTIPTDNPFPDSPVYSYGHRNPQGIAWNESGDLFMSTHGPSGEFGLYAKDRVDYITPGTNYGWPEAYGPDQGFPNPLAYWPDTATPPGGMAFWNGSLFVATLKSAALVQLDIQKTDDGYELHSENRWFEGKYGRLRDVTVGPDGNMYLLTSNGDGRSGSIGGEDVILKIEKK